jgi:hypothetical protein
MCEHDHHNHLENLSRSKIKVERILKLGLDAADRIRLAHSSSHYTHNSENDNELHSYTQ